MSKITDAMAKAEQERTSLSWAGNPAVSEHLNVLKQELHEKIQLADEVVKPGPSRALAASGRHGTETEQPRVPLSEASTEVAPHNAGPSQSQAYSPVSWEEAVERAQRQLEECERQAARHTGEQARLQGQLTVSKQLIEQIEQERVVLRQRLEQMAQLGASIEAAKATWTRRLEALRGYQVLSHEAKMTEEELQANTALIACMDQSQQRLTAELAHYRRRSQALEQRVSELMFQMAQVLAATGTETTRP